LKATTQFDSVNLLSPTTFEISQEYKDMVNREKSGRNQKLKKILFNILKQEKDQDSSNNSVMESKKSIYQVKDLEYEEDKKK